MKLTITIRKIDVSDSQRDKIEKSLNSLDRYFNQIISTELLLDKERVGVSADLKLKVSREFITAHARSADVVAAVLEACDKVKAQLKKHKSKLKEKDPKKVTRTTERLTRPKTNPEDLDR